MEEAYSRFVGRLVEYRKKYGYYQKDICKKINTSQSHYSKMERMDKIIPYEALIKLNENGINVDFLFTGIQPERTKLNELMDECPPEGKADFMHLMTIYMDMAARHMNSGAEKINDIREMELLKYNLEEHHDKTDTMWSRIRKTCGLTQEQMAKVLDVGINKYREIEKGIKNPNAEILACLYGRLGYVPSLILNMEPNYMFTLNEAWKKLTEDKQQNIIERLEKNLKYIKEI